MNHEISARLITCYERLRTQRFDPASPRESLLRIARIMFVEMAERDAGKLGITDLAAFFDTAVAAMMLYGTFVMLLQLEELDEPTEDECSLILGRHEAYFDDLIDQAIERFELHEAEEQVR
jgi:hypothetical protein